MISPKVTAGVLAGAVAMLIVGVLGQFGIELDANTAQALSTLLAFAAGYFKIDTTKVESTNDL